ncbi:A-kinase anchor protein 9 isoform X4 [Takifugu rubripes]|uniref:Pericentrin/AKAP-450 centrosomal targeting domain-containing protein n=1 Tax=Takifugu rubripes TaxID=31033 RepID=A0A674N929_TAKRU|nr:A-kinase anchor protein 9 isoform X4 [Takifugu rubripes]
MQPQMESQVMSRSQETDSREDSTDGYQGDGDSINRAVRKHVFGHDVQEGENRADHGECRLQTEAQRLSLSQIHAAQFELLQEETEALTHSLELKLQQQSGRGDPAGPKLLQSINVSQVVQKECTEIIKSFQKIFGEKLLESIEVEEWKPPLKREDTSDSPSVLMEARELYGDLQQLKETIEQEHFRLSQLQSLLRDDGSKIIELQTAYDDLKSSSEQQISALRGQVAGLSSSSSKDVEEQTVTPSACISEELQRLRAEEQVKQLQLEESHREEVECLRAHYQQQATETEERYLTELLMLQQQLQDVTRAQAHSRATESGREWSEAHSEELQKKPGEEESEEGVDLRSPVGSVGLAAQLQALRTTLHQKYVQEVAALTEQHNRELRRVREEKELDWKREKEEDFNDTHRSGRSEEVSTAAGQDVHGKKQDWERTEEEVAKAIVQMSVQFAQQTELVRLNKRSCQRSSSMQTVQSGPEQMEETGNEEPTPRASPSLSSWLEEVERLKTELEERNIVIGTLKKELQKIQSGPEQKRENGQEEDLEEGESERLERTQEDGGKLRRDPGEAPDRNILLKTNENLSQVLLEVLKTTAAAEETLSLHMQSLAASSGSTPPSHASECHQSSEPSTEDADSWSREMEADKSLKMSHQTIDSLLLGVGTRLDSEDYLMGISSRLQTALEKMLMVITDTTNQLEHARLTQTELMRESFRHNQEMNELLQKQEELQERLTEEARAREQLALELHRAEDLIDGYTGERAALEEQLHQKEELHLSLEQELQVTSSRLHELEQERLQMQEERELLSRQQDAMREHAGPRELRLVEAAMVAAPEADLLEETEKLMKEKVEVQRQAEKENTDLLKHNKLLEAELEEQVSRVFELEQTQMMERRDLQQQIQALEKQLEKNRKFLDEQAVDREHERDFFQQEIQKLEQQLKAQQKQQPGSEHRNQEVDRLTSQLKEKADWCSELLLSSEQLRRELQERDEEIDKLESRIRELEQALLTSAESLEKNQHATITETKQTTLESQLQTEREALERKEKEICNLEEQLEQFREELENKSEEVQQLQMQLEIQRKEISSQQEYLETRDSLLQVMEAKDREITLLNEQITKLQHMETTSDNKELDDREELIKELESRVECLRGEQERLKRNKEEEVDQLNAVIDKLQQELSNIEQKQVSEEDEDTGAEQESAAWALDKEEYDQMKQSMDLATKELTKLKTEHTRLLKNYLCLKESAKALAETEQPQSPDPELEDALIQKTAGLVVMQAQVQALEQSATSRLEELGLRVQELEEALNEKEGELQHCRLQLEQAEGHAEDWQQKASELEVKLGDKGDEVLAVQQQPEGSQEMEARLGHVEPRLMANVDPHRYDFGIPKMDFREIGQLRQASTGKVFHLTQRLQELEVGLSGIQKDQELQKQLLSSSEEEVLEYERRLSVLMDLLRQMKSRTHQRASAAAEASSSDDPRSPAEVQQELQEVRAEVLVTKEELVSYKDTCGRLTEELQEKNGTIQKLKDQLDKVDESRVSELRGELTEAQSEAAAAKEELSSCRERLEKLQELLQEREMTIAHLSGELCQLKAEKDRDDKTDHLLENRNDPFSTKEEFESYRKHNEKLEEDLQLRDISITKLTEELLEKKEKVDATKELLDSHRQHKEKLQEEVRLRDISITKLTEELQEMKEKLDTIQDLRQHKEKLQEELHDVSVFKLKEELQEMKEKVDATKEELDSNRQHNEQLQEEVQLRDVSIFKLKEELQEMEDKLDTANVELDSNRQHKEKLQEEVHLRDLSISKLEEEIQELKAKLDTTQELDSNRQHKEKLQEEVHLRDLSISKLEEEIQELKAKLDTTQELDSNRQHKENLQEEVHLRDLSISKLEEEIQELKAKLDTTQELDSNRQHKEKLQEEVHLRDLSIAKLKEELQKLRENLDTTEEEFSSFKQHQGKIHQDLQVCEGSMSKLEEELQEKRKNLETTEKELSIYRQHNEKLQEELQVCKDSLSDLAEELQEMRHHLDTSQENLNSFRQHNEQLQEEAHVHELSISKLKEELQDAQKELVRAVDCVPPSPSPSPSPQPLSSASSSSTAQPKRKGVKQPSGKGSIVKDKPTLSRKTSNQTSGKSHSTRLNSRSEQQSVAVTHSSTQTEPLRLSDLGPDSKTHTNDEMEEVLGEFREKIVQMQELHAAEILDMEARHISESESLRRDTQALEEECKALRAAIDKLRCPELRPGNVASQFNFSTVQASRPDRPASLFRDDYTSDSSSDYSQRTGFDIPSLQQELRTTPEGARRDPDDPLPDRIKTLLREVHQEGMQVLSLSELPISEGESGHVQGWVKERDDLLTTVESLRGLITQMQIKTSGNEDWRVQLLDAVRRVFLSERNVLRSALYSQLDTLDTSDAIIHLNRLEQRLAEQDAQHREAMDSLHLADRSSLMSEIHQLRGQLERVHHGESTGHGLIEKREGGGGDRAAESDRLLLEELKGELSQTKLELETTLKAQHKHLKEMDALRAEVSQKAAEVDALTDRLTEEKKRSRDLQWAAEKERCETDRKEESKREELEDLQLTLEDQKDRVAQLTVTLEQERQASARLSEQAERERLSLHRRLQELQVQLETEKAKALEMSTALGRERELRTGVSSRSGPSSELGEDTAGQEVDGSLLEKLQRELDDKHAQVVHLLSQLEVQKLEVVQKEEELTAGRRELRREQEALQVARAQLETLEAQISESQEQLGRELEKSKDLEEERERLEGKVHWFIEQSGAREDDVSLGDSTDRTKDWVFQQKSGNIQSPSASPAACGPWRTVDKILSKLYLISSRVSSMASKPTDRPTAEVEHEDLSWVQTNVEEVITMLQQCPGLPAVPESASLLPGGSSSTLTQRLLRQNAELTGFVSRLTEEKNDLRNQTLRLEEEIRRYRQAGPATGEGFNFRKGVSKSDSSGMLLSQEREAWTREKVRLEKALHQAQAQVARLRGEIRSDTLREMTGPEADNAALKRIYGKYLRSESFRKALIYQKKYLLLLLGGFQECEEATLSLLSRMGGQPALSTLESIHQRRRGLTRFRSAVRVSIALSRMRFLVKRWHKTTGISSATSGTVSKTGAGQTPGTDARDSPYLHPGSVETYRERGGGGVSGGRGRSGRESPRSVASSTHHRFHLAGEHGGLTCSHLQSYDPDRALTDYISRLEALQRRLGSVTSGATSYAQLHFGLRR